MCRSLRATPATRSRRGLARPKGLALLLSSSPPMCPISIGCSLCAQTSVTDAENIEPIRNWAVSFSIFGYVLRLPHNETKCIRMGTTREIIARVVPSPPRIVLVRYALNTAFVRSLRLVRRSASLSFVKPGFSGTIARQIWRDEGILP